MNKINTLWNEEYRPSNIDECIIPKRIKSVLTGYLNNNDCPSLLFYGPAGCCKTTTAKAIANSLNAEYIFINASDETGKADILNSVIPFATGVSIHNSNVPKLIILDESDRMTPAAQDSIKSYMESFSSNCRFIFTANTPSKIISPIKSRCLCFDFNIQSSEKPELMFMFMKRLCSILEKKNIQYDPKVLQRLIVKDFPDYRVLMNTVQAYATANNTINEGILTFNTADIVDELYRFIKNKDFDGVRKWLYETNCSQEEIFRAIYAGMLTNIDSKKIPESIVILADYQARADHVIIPQVNILACLVELMNGM